MAKLLLFQHVPYEPLGTLSPLLRERGHRVRYINFSRDPYAQPDISKYAAIIILGGPGNVDQIDQYPYLQTEIDVINQALAAEMPILGICLGGQLLAAALGGKVYPAKEKEIGWTDIQVTETGKQDPLFKHWQATEKIFQWHGRTFDLPDQATLLATNNTCPNQAFRVGDNVYGFQFHLEVNELLISRWANLPLYQADLDSAAPDAHRQRILANTKKYIENTYQLSNKVFGAFIDLLPDVDRGRTYRSR